MEILKQSRTTQSSNPIRNTIKVMIGNGSALINGVVTGFVIPKILSIDGYGYSRVFALYATYLGMCHLGIVDGISLMYGGCDYENLPKREIRWLWKWFAAVNVIISVAVMIFACFLNDSQTRFLWLSLTVEMCAVNTTTYFQQISQITQRFTEYSQRKTLMSLANIISVLFLGYYALKGHEIRYQAYIMVHLAVNVSFALWYVYSYWELIAGKCDSLFTNSERIIKCIQCGFPLLVANMCSTLLLTLDRQFVSVLFDTRTYAVYAFAYNLLALISVASTAVSTVFYPFLMRSSKQKGHALFSKMVSWCLVFMMASCTAYYPLVFLVDWFLPQYHESLTYLRLIFPGMSLTSVITVVFQNYEKAEGRYMRYFVKSIAALAISFFLNCGAYALFRNPVAISAASILAALFWYCSVGVPLSKTKQFQMFPTILYSILMAVLFYWTTGMEHPIIGGVFYLTGVVLGSFLFFKTQKNKL